MDELGGASSRSLELLREYLLAQRYSLSVVRNYLVNARAFLRHLEEKCAGVDAVTPKDVEQYVQGLRRRGDQKALPPAWRRAHRAAIQLLLRRSTGSWPPSFQSTRDDDVAIQKVVSDYDAWMVEVRGLSLATRDHGRREAAFLLSWLRDQNQCIAALNVELLDAYITWRCRDMRRSSKSAMVSTLRGVIRYLYRAKKIPSDLTALIEGPPIYAFEKIPSTIRREDIDSAVQAAKSHGSALGRRDYAIMMLLSTYGLRGGEIRNLQLADIDWKHDRVRIHHTKTGACSELPLMPAVADALFEYLRHGRPETSHREVFIRACAPYKPLKTTGALSSIVVRWLLAVGVSLEGRRGAHVLRHSRAASLLRGGVPLKVIGDILGHRSTHSTAVYLKLATDDLRLVALDLTEEMML